MSYLKDIKESLKNIDDLCGKALKESDDCEFYIREINWYANEVLDNFENLINKLKIGEEKLIEASKLLKNTLTKGIE